MPDLLTYYAADVDDPRYAMVCNICGSVVINRKKHNAFHNKAGF